MSRSDAVALDAAVVVVGVGVMGEAVARALWARGHAMVLIDDRPRPAHQCLAAELATPVHPAPARDDDAAWQRLFAGAAAFLPTPGLPESHPAFAAAAQAAVPVISEFDLAAAWDDRPIVAITGTNGKTTVTMMVTAMLDASSKPAQAVGNTDIPLVAALADPGIEIFVVEASSFRLGHSRRFRPAVATWLNFAPDHLDVHRDLAGYEAAKARIWADQDHDAVAIGNFDDPVVARHLHAVKARSIGFSARPVAAPTPGCYGVSHGTLHDDHGEPLLDVTELARSLPHDIANALAALATARAAGASRDAAVAVAKTWRSLPHRVQPVGEGGGLLFVDDSKATTPHATLAAVAGFDSVVLLAGGQNKGLDLSPLRDAAPRLRAVVAIGAAAAEVAAVFDGLTPEITVRSVTTNMHDAVRVAAEQAQPGDVVLLSPACASFDWYRNYGERGEDFARAVQAWLGGAQ